MTYDNSKESFFIEIKEKTAGLLHFMDARNFDTKKALKNIRLYRELLDKTEKHIIEYEISHDFPGKNPKSADFDCERYIREKDLQYIKDEIREAYKAGFMFLLHNPEFMGNAEKQE